MKNVLVLLFLFLNFEATAVVPRSPYLRADFEQTKTLYIGTTTRVDLSPTYHALIAALPPRLNVIFVENESLLDDQTVPAIDLKRMTQEWKSRRSDLNIDILTLAPNYETLWLRDSLPLPSITKEEGYAFKYFKENSSYKIIASREQLKLKYYDTVFEGGNLVSDGNGMCFSTVMEDLGELGHVPAAFLLQSGACKKILNIPYSGGIGHADERIVFLNPQLAATDDEGLSQKLKLFGYKVILIPRSHNSDLSYINSLIINDRILIPVFGLPTDAAAIRAFEKSGLKVFPIPSLQLAENLLGSLHCITRNY